MMMVWRNGEPSLWATRHWLAPLADRYNTSYGHRIPAVPRCQRLLSAAETRLENVGHGCQLRVAEYGEKTEIHGTDHPADHHDRQDRRGSVGLGEAIGGEATEQEEHEES